MADFGIKKYWTQAAQKVSQLVENMGTTEGMENFLESTDHDHDGTITSLEIKAVADSNFDGQISDEEWANLALTAQTADFNQVTIQTMGAAAMKAQTNVSLFSKSADGNWASTPELKILKAQSLQQLPLNTEVLASRKLDEVAKARKGVFQIQEQVGNSCGTTSLSMVLKYFQGHTLENSVPTIDTYIRAQGQLDFILPTGEIKDIKIDGYTAPRDIVRYANGHGMRAGMKNDASLRDLKRMLDQGVPCLCLTDWNFSGGDYEMPMGGKPDAESLHWVNVIGYQELKHPQTDKMETAFVVANPHGVAQTVFAEDFDKVWSGYFPSGQGQKITGNTKVESGLKRLFIAMVPKDDDVPIIAPDGTTNRAGRIGIPRGQDGVRGKLVQMGSELLKKATELQKKTGQTGTELWSDATAGYEQGGLKGLVANLLFGNTADVITLRQKAKAAGVVNRAEILNHLLDLQITRSQHKNLIYEILKDTPWTEFNTLIGLTDMKQLAKELGDTAQSGYVLAWIAKSEIDKSGTTGPKFELYSSYLAEKHQATALASFLDNPYTQESHLVHQIPAGIIRNMLKQLQEGKTWNADENVIHKLLKATDWPQFGQVIKGLNMKNVATEMENESQLANLFQWSCQSACKTGNWTPVSEMLSRLEATSLFASADNILGDALFNLEKSELDQIPTHLRKRMVDLLDDRTRWRSDKAIAALKSL